MLLAIAHCVLLYGGTSPGNQTLRTVSINILPRANTYRMDRQMHLRVSNPEKTNLRFLVGIEPVYGKITIPEDYAGDIYAKSSQHHGLLHVGPGKTMDLFWTPSARPKTFRPRTGIRFRFVIYTADALEGGGLCYNSEPFKFKPTSKLAHLKPAR